MMTRYDHGKGNAGKKDKTLRNSTVPRTPVMKNKDGSLKQTEDTTYQPPIIVSTHQSYYKSYLNNDFSDHSSFIPHALFTSTGNNPTTPHTKKPDPTPPVPYKAPQLMNWSEAIEANEEARSALPHSGHAAAIEVMRREARRETLQTSGHMVQNHDMAARRAQAKENKRKKEEKKLKKQGGGGDSQDIDLSNDPSLKELFVEWNELKGRIEEVRVREAEANNIRRKKNKGV